MHLIRNEVVVWHWDAGGSVEGSTTWIMVEIIRCNEPVLLSWVEALLKDAGIDAVILDQHTTSVWGESLSAVSRRLLVPDDDAEAARQLLEAANLGNQLRI